MNDWISPLSKFLYGLFLDRVSLSRKNNWIDDQGRVYIIYTSEELQEDLCISINKVTSLTKELINVDLIEKKRRGLGRSDLIYVKRFENTVYSQIHKNSESAESFENTEVDQIHKICESRITKNVNLDSQNMGRSKTDLSNTDTKTTTTKKGQYQRSCHHPQTRCN